MKCPICGAFPIDRDSEAKWAEAEADRAALRTQFEQEKRLLDEAVNDVWDNVLRAVQQAWPEPQDYGDCPTELIARVIDERDAAEASGAALRTQLEQVTQAHAPLRALITRWRETDADEASARGYRETANALQVCANALEAALAPVEGRPPQQEEHEKL